jgi:FtsP/CotA-like multicopper oxidase with cupredoxin domain
MLAAIMRRGERSVVVAVGLAVLLLLLLLAGCGDDKKSNALQSAPVYASKDGVLHLRVKARTTTSSIAGKTYKHMDIYETSLVDGKGTFTPGNTSSYVGAQWSVLPGDTMIIDYINDLEDARFTPIGSTKVLKIPQPINLHTHGLTVSPSGNGDNVLLAIPQHRSNRFTIKIPKSQYHGLYWYHPHIHGITDEQVYNGLAGHIVVGRADGDYRQFNGLRVHPMMIRYNVVDPGTDKGGEDGPGDMGELIDASPWDTKGTALKKPDGKPRGKMIYTVNGQLRPEIKVRAATSGKPAESQVWAMTNITGSASYILALDEVAKRDAQDTRKKGTAVDFTIVSEDGTPMPRPKVLAGKAAARGYLLGQGGRVAILVQGPSDPSKVVRLIQVENRSGTGDASAYDRRSEVDGKKVKPHAIGGWRDYTRDVLAVTADDPKATRPHVATPAKLTTNYAVHTERLENARVDHKRTFVFDGVAPSTAAEPNNFPVNDALFAFNRVDQPKAGTVEEWTILNYSSLHHPFHVHTQYGKVMSIDAPVNPKYADPKGEFPSLQYVTDLSQPKPAAWTQDIVNLPPAKVDSKHGNPVLGRDGKPVAPGKVVLRLRFEDYLGEYVEHCHRLPHEDRGMMSLVRTIPHDPVYAVSSGGRVSVYRSSDDRPVRSLVPFPRGRGPVSTAIGDVDGDTIPDLAVGSGAGTRTVVRIYSGASKLRTRIAQVVPFDESTRGASVALGDLNGDGRDDLVAGMGSGGRPRVAIFDGETRARLADFDAYEAGVRGGVSVATGMLEEGGRLSLVTGAGPGGPPTVKVFNFDLFGNRQGTFPDIRKRLAPLEVAAFDGSGSADRGGVTVATGDPYAARGGFSDVLVAPRSGRGSVRIFAIHQHHDPAEKDVALSGVARPHDYDPDADRMAMPLGRLRLESGPVSVGALSTWTGAQLVVAPRAGGRASLWAAQGKSLRLSRVKTLDASGTAASGI